MSLLFRLDGDPEMIDYLEYLQFENDVTNSVDDVTADLSTKLIVVKLN